MRTRARTRNEGVQASRRCRKIHTNLQGVLLTNQEYKRHAAAARYSGCPRSSRRNARMLEQGAEGVGGAVCATG